MTDTIGLLALQGDFGMHRINFAALGAKTQLVRRRDELEGCAGLVIPGGESTTLARLIRRGGLEKPLQDFATERAVMGTCAGLILLARELAPEPGGHHGVTPLGMLDCTVQRNGYGRQVDSFSETVTIDTLNGSRTPFLAVFIRAPRILAVGSQVEVIAARAGEPVAIRQGHLLGLTFHPELANDTRIHAAFLKMVKSQ
jgi:5'-phosphate synthase pdxT subunit